MLWEELLVEEPEIIPLVAGNIADLSCPGCKIAPALE